MFRPQFDYGPYRAQLQALSRVQIPDVLDDAFAAQFHAALAAETG